MKDTLFASTGTFLMQKGIFIYSIVQWILNIAIAHCQLYVIFPIFYPKRFIL
jgi:hypothetical protein